MIPGGGYPGQVIKQYNGGAFGQWDLSDCGPKIEDANDIWYIKDDQLDPGEIGVGPWALRIEVDFAAPGYEDETVLTSPVYSKY